MNKKLVIGLLMFLLVLTIVNANSHDPLDDALARIPNTVNGLTNSQIIGLGLNSVTDKAIIQELQNSGSFIHLLTNEVFTLTDGVVKVKYPHGRVVKFNAAGELTEITPPTHTLDSSQDKLFPPTIKNSLIARGYATDASGLSTYNFDNQGNVLISVNSKVDSTNKVNANTFDFNVNFPDGAEQFKAFNTLKDNGDFVKDSTFTGTDGTVYRVVEETVSTDSTPRGPTTGDSKKVLKIEIIKKVDRIEKYYIPKGSTTRSAGTPPPSSTLRRTSATVTKPTVEESGLTAFLNLENEIEKLQSSIQGAESEALKNEQKALSLDEKGDATGAALLRLKAETLRRDANVNKVVLRGKLEDLDRQGTKIDSESLLTIGGKLDKFKKGDSGGYTHDQAYQGALKIVEQENQWLETNSQEVEWYGRYKSSQDFLKLHGTLNSEDQAERLKDADYAKQHAQATQFVLISDKNNAADRENRVKSHLDRKNKAEKYAEAGRWKGSFVENLGGSLYGSLVEGDSFIGTIGSVGSTLIGKVSRYRALSNLLLPDLTQKWMENAQAEFLQDWSNLPSYAVTHWGLGLPGVDSCQLDDVKRSEIPGQSSVFYQTSSGTYQPAGKIFAEKSENEAIIPCMVDEDNKPFCKLDEDGREIFYCKPDGLCYESRDSVEPRKGKFYKVTFGVSSPTDESFTPYVDENGVAVKFNIWLENEENENGVWYFERGSIKEDNVIELKNGDSDGQTIYFYSIQRYKKACIKFNLSGRIEDQSNHETIDEICADFVVSDKGEVNFLESNKKAPSVPSTSGEITVNRNI